MTKRPSVTMQAMQKVVQMEDVQVERWPTVIGRTVIGTLLIAIGVAGLGRGVLNQYLAIGLVLLGATTWSTRLVTNSLKALIQPVAAIRRAVDRPDEPKD